MIEQTKIKPTPNYSPELCARLQLLYEELGNEGIEEIAKELDKTVKSVRSKLVNAGIYNRNSLPATIKTEMSKKEILRELEKLKFNTQGFEGATRSALYRLLGVVRN